jgi:hypothetical protein
VGRLEGGRQSAAAPAIFSAGPPAYSSNFHRRIRSDRLAMPIVDSINLPHNYYIYISKTIERQTAKSSRIF